MMMTDRNIFWKRKKLYVPVAQCGLGSLGGLTMTQFRGPAYGLKISAVGTPTEFAIKLPVDVNPDFPLGFRIAWGAIGTPATMGNCSWITLAVMKQVTEALLTAATGALDTVHTLVQTPPAANAWTYTSRGIRNAGFSTKAQIMAGAILQTSVELDAVSGTIDATNAAFLLGLELDYVPMKTRFPHSELDAPLDNAAP